jgi:hypothetical protein
MSALRLTLVLVAAAALSGCGVMDRMTGGGASTIAAPPPAELSPTDRAIAAIEENGCTLTAANLSSVLIAANLTQAEFAAIQQDLAASGRLEVTADGAVRVLSDRCI